MADYPPNDTMLVVDLSAPDEAVEEDTGGEAAADEVGKD